MEITSVRVHGFRNILDETIELGPSINVFVGDNGQGKTNFLEALYFCSRGRSFRTSKTEHLVNTQTKRSLITVNFKSIHLSHKIEARISEREKNFSLDGKKVASTFLQNKIPTVLFSPESLQSIKDGPDERRKLVDDLIVSIDSQNAKIILEFEKAVKMKNKVLRDHLEGVLNRTQALDILESMTPAYIERAVALTNSRLEALRQLAPKLKETFSSIINKPDVDISVDYVISDQSAMGWDEKNVYDAIRKRQQELLLRELESGLCLVGPHKHEIRFLYNRKDSRFFCSQGQQRTIVLSFKISQVLYYKKVHKRSPVLLLDDVLSELDSERRDYLVRFLKESHAQTIVTTTDLAFCEELRSERLSEFQVHEGHFSQMT